MKKVFTGRIYSKKEFVIRNEYECEICGMKFGHSLGDMELHKLLTHLQNNDIILNLKKITNDTQN
jgi:hypothetical protein